MTSNVMEAPMPKTPMTPLLEPVGLGPVPLSVLASYMRDGVWLDLRCDNELIERVRIIEITVRVQGEDIVVRQEWLNEDTEDDDHYYNKHTFNIDSDAIWRAVPTTRHPGEVRPYGIDVHVKRKPQDEELQQRISVAVLNSARSLWGLTPEELRKVTDWKGIGPRYACLIVVYEMSDLEAPAICRLLGYQSVQPLVSARCNMQRPHDDMTRGRLAMVLKLGRAVDEQFPPPPPRTTRAFPHDYKPLLKR